LFPNKFGGEGRSKPQEKTPFSSQEKGWG